MILRALVVWFLIMICAIANGGFREIVLNPKLGPKVGHVLSTMLLSIVILLASYLSIGWLHPVTLKRAVIIGAEWTALTLAFEFLAGHYLFGNSWEKILADYNVFKGRIWVLVPIVTFVAPVLMYLLRASARAPMSKRIVILVAACILQFPILFIICLPVLLVRAAIKQGAYWSNVKEDAKSLFGWWLDHLAWLGPW